MKNQKNELVRQTKEQGNPALLLPEDMVILTAKDAEKFEQPFNGSCGETDAEYAELQKQITCNGGLSGKSALSDSPKQP